MNVQWNSDIYLSKVNQAVPYKFHLKGKWGHLVLTMKNDRTSQAVLYKPHFKGKWGHLILTMRNDRQKTIVILQMHNSTQLRLTQK